LLPSRALSRPAQVCPGWTMSTPPCNTSSANGDNPLNFVSHARGSLHALSPTPPTSSYSTGLRLMVDLRVDGKLGLRRTAQTGRHLRPAGNSDSQ
jgi:hypothetical protein